ncbi:hypothetical protein CK203_014020, partial [Vitis vinifera]
RTRLFSNKDWVLDADEGICKLMVETQGYACEEHKDGYILSVQRIPMGQSGEASAERAPVLLQHGALLMVSNFAA